MTAETKILGGIDYSKFVEIKWIPVPQVGRFEPVPDYNMLFAAQLGRRARGFDRLLVCKNPLDNNPRFTVVHKFGAAIRSLHFSPACDCLFVGGIAPDGRGAVWRVDLRSLAVEKVLETESGVYDIHSNHVGFILAMEAFADPRRVYVSTDCGKTWRKALEISGVPKYYGYCGVYNSQLWGGGAALVLGGLGKVFKTGNFGWDWTDGSRPNTPPFIGVVGSPVGRVQPFGGFGREEYIVVPGEFSVYRLWVHPWVHGHEDYYVVEMIWDEEPMTPKVVQVSGYSKLYVSVRTGVAWYAGWTQLFAFVDRGETVLKTPIQAVWHSLGDVAALGGRLFVASRPYVDDGWFDWFPRTAGILVADEDEVLSMTVPYQVRASVANYPIRDTDEHYTFDPYKGGTCISMRRYQTAVFLVENNLDQDVTVTVQTDQHPFFAHKPVDVKSTTVSAGTRAIIAVDRSECLTYLRLALKCSVAPTTGSVRIEVIRKP